MPSITARIAVRTAAVTAWVAETLTCFLCRHPSPLHELMGVSTIVLSVWAIAERFGGHRLKPGERIVSDSYVHEMEASITRAVLVGVREAQAQPPKSLQAAHSR